MASLSRAGASGQGSWRLLWKGIRLTPAVSSKQPLCRPPAYVIPPRTS